MNYSKPIQWVEWIKKTVIKYRTSGELKKADVLTKALEAYQKSRITISTLWSIYKQLQ